MPGRKKALWGTYPLKGETPVVWHTGPLYLWILSRHDEIWITHQHLPGMSETKEESQVPAPPSLEDPVWQRWAVKSTVEKLDINPVFPDLPVVVKPEYPFRLTPGIKTRIYVRVPLWVRIQIGTQPLLELPIVILSKTWFGDFLEGELCYWISSSARKVYSPDPLRPYMSICPIQIYNRSADELLVEKICLRVRKLALFQYQDQLWGSETRASYKGVEEGS
ncbi:MAG: hypothetical protein D6732_22160, partial [Methanobacteriota archaeon]